MTNDYQKTLESVAEMLKKQDEQIDKLQRQNIANNAEILQGKAEVINNIGKQQSRKRLNW